MCTSNDPTRRNRALAEDVARSYLILTRAGRYSYSRSASCCKHGEKEVINAAEYWKLLLSVVTAVIDSDSPWTLRWQSSSATWLLSNVREHFYSLRFKPHRPRNYSSEWNSAVSGGTTVVSVPAYRDSKIKPLSVFSASCFLLFFW